MLRGLVNSFVLTEAKPWARPRCWGRGPGSGMLEWLA